MSEDFNDKSMRKILDHPIRQRIIELLGIDGPLSWKELSDKIGISTGVLYYHLDTLEGLVSKDKSKKYSLTKFGYRVSQYLRDSTSPTPDRVVSAIGMKDSWRIPRALFTPRALVGRLGSSDRTGALSTLAISVGLVGLMSAFGFAPALYYLAPSSAVWVTSIGYAVTLVALTGVGFASASILSDSPPNLAVLVPGCALSLLPVAALGALVRLVPYLSKASPLFTAFMIFAQAWGAAFFASSLSVSTGLRIEKGIVVSLALLYGSVVAILFLNGIL